MDSDAATAIAGFVKHGPFVAKTIGLGLAVFKSGDGLAWGAEPLGAKLAGADLSGTRYNSRTSWPTGFDPKEAGAVKAINIDEE